MLTRFVLLRHNQPDVLFEGLHPPPRINNPPPPQIINPSALLNGSAREAECGDHNNVFWQDRIFAVCHSGCPEPVFTSDFQSKVWEMFHTGDFKVQRRGLWAVRGYGTHLNTKFLWNISSYFLNYKYLNCTCSIFSYIIIFTTQIIHPHFIFIDFEEIDELKLKMSRHWMNRTC